LFVPLGCGFLLSFRRTLSCYLLSLLLFGRFFASGFLGALRLEGLLGLLRLLISQGGGLLLGLRCLLGGDLLSLLLLSGFFAGCSGRFLVTLPSHLLPVFVC
jgi:hypothetical protein